MSTPFKLGDVVRLQRGWTPLIVIEINGHMIRAKYASSPDYPVTRLDYIQPECSCGTQHRTYHAFVHWDGKKPISQIMKDHYIMSTRYRVVACPALVGTYLNTTSTGEMVLEMENHSIRTFKPHELEEDIPVTFKAKSLHSGYTCHYEVPANATISEGDLLVSDSGNAYRVMETNTKMRNPKGVFKGSRILTQGL